jgi:hypothetical protein
MLEQERDRAKPAHVQQLQHFLDTLRPNYERAKQRYIFTTRAKKRRAYRNWCNTGLDKQAADCGATFSRLYHVVYSRLSAYIHGSEWSRRRQLAYSRYCSGRTHRSGSVGGVGTLLR